MKFRIFNTSLLAGSLLLAAAQSANALTYSIGGSFSAEVESDISPGTFTYYDIFFDLSGSIVGSSGSVSDASPDLFLMIPSPFGSTVFDETNTAYDAVFTSGSLSSLTLGGAPDASTLSTFPDDWVVNITDIDLVTGDASYFISAPFDTGSSGTGSGSLKLDITVVPDGGATALLGFLSLGALAGLRRFKATAA